MGADSRRRVGGKGVKPNINVTPLVDVVLVLLIIFMVIIPNMQDGKPIEMINVFHPDQDAEEKDEPLTLTIDRSEHYLDDDASCRARSVLAELRETHARSARRKLLIRADATLPLRAGPRASSRRSRRSASAASRSQSARSAPGTARRGGQIAMAIKLGGSSRSSGSSPR